MEAASEMIQPELTLTAGPPSGSDVGFSGRRTAEVVGITYRQLDYWARTDLVRPSLADASGSGTRRLYSYLDLLELKVIKRLLDAGINLEKVRSVFEYIKQDLGGDIAAADLVISGSNSVIVREGEDLIDVMRSGQGVLNIVLSLGDIKSELDASIHQLYATPAPAAEVSYGGNHAVV